MPRPPKLAPAARPTREDLLVPVDVPSAYEVVAERLRHLIHLGTFAPGERLPAERELARQLGVSRVTLREALRVLEGSGYIETRRRGGGGPAIVGSGQSTELLRATLAQRIDYFDDVVDFRVAVEGMAARLAAERRTDSDIEAIRGAVDALAEGGIDVARFRRADSAFHLAIAEAARNEMLRTAIEDARDRMFTPTDAMPFELMLPSTTEAHTLILSAIERGDPEAAEKAMVNHIEHTHDELRVALGLPPRAEPPQGRQ